MSTTAKTRSPRAIVEAWAAARLRDNDGPTATSELITAARQHFDCDHEFTDALFAWAAEEIIPTAVRRAARNAGHVPLSEGRTINRATLTHRATSSRGPWDAWRERITHTKRDGHTIELPDMRREHVIEEHIRHREDARDSLITAGFLKTLSDRMGTDGETVRETFTPDELQQALDTSTERFTAKGDA